MVKVFLYKFKTKLTSWLRRNLRNEIDIIRTKLDKLEGLVSNSQASNNVLSNNSVGFNSSDNIIRVVFLVQNGEFWPVLASIFEAMKQHVKFQPIILMIPTRYSDNTEYEYRCMDLFDRNKDNVFIYDDFKQIGVDCLSYINPDIIFRQAPWDHLIPDYFRTNNIKHYRICYASYAIQTVDMGAMFYNQSLHNVAWRLYCDNQYLMDCYRYYNLTQDINAKVVGILKFEYMMKHLDQCKTHNWPLASKSRNARVKILWCSHHSLENWLGFATLHKNYKDVISFAKHNPDYDIVFRPHPATKTAFVSNNKMSEEDYDDFINNLESLTNVFVDASSDYLHLFQHSDVLVTDGISFLFEYLITNKPIIFIDSMNHAKFNEFYQDIDESWYKIALIKELDNVITNLLRGKDPLRIAREKCFSKIYNDCAQEPSKLIIEDILNSFSNMR